MSLNIVKRMSDLQMCNPHDLELLAYIPIAAVADQLAEETAWHRAWKRLSKRGEWFRLERELINAIEAQIRVGRAVRVNLVAPLGVGEMFSPDRPIMSLTNIAAGLAAFGVSHHMLRDWRARNADFPKVRGGSPTRGWLYDSIEMRDYALNAQAKKTAR